MYRRRIGLSTAIAKNTVRKSALIAIKKTAVQFPTDWNSNAANGHAEDAATPDTARCSLSR